MSYFQADSANMRLERMNHVIASHIADQLIPGAVMLIAQHGKIIHQQALG